MLLAVAGLSELEIQERAMQLAKGNWSVFDAKEQRAFQLAHQISAKPAKLTDRDIQLLKQSVGKHRAVDMIWFSSWCNYMTRVADAFQLPLETRNVFQRPRN